MNALAHSSTEFDAYVAVDWSANSKPKSGSDSIWIAWGRWDRGKFNLMAPTNPRTRSEAMGLVNDLLQTLVAGNERVLIGFDFAYGYPAGFAAALSLGTQAAGWLSVWNELSQLIQDSAGNANNRFHVASNLNARIGPPGPFWCCPSSNVTPSLSTRRGFSFPHTGSAGAPLAEYRIVEQELRNKGAMAHSIWKLFTTGSVGSQALLGIPRLGALVNDPALRKKTSIWPFETGFRIPDRAQAQVIHVEIWPGLFEVDLRRHKTKDAAQVLSVVDEFAMRDANGLLAPLFTPTGLPRGKMHVCQQEEGWILGA